MQTRNEISLLSYFCLSIPLSVFLSLSLSLSIYLSIYPSLSSSLSLSVPLSIYLSLSLSLSIYLSISLSIYLSHSLSLLLFLYFYVGQSVIESTSQRILFSSKLINSLQSRKRPIVWHIYIAISFVELIQYNKKRLIE